MSLEVSLQVKNQKQRQVVPFLREKRKQKSKVSKTTSTTELNKPNLDTWEGRVDLLRKIQRPEELSKYLISHIEKLISDSGLTQEMIFLYDPDSEIRDWTGDKIYNSLSNLERKELILFIHNSGGAIEPAYFISKACKELSKKFQVVIPRKAKSAATLLSLGADEIHMGLMSQLGPIDPQVNGLPALAVNNTIMNLAKMCEEYPQSSDMFAKYLSLTLSPVHLGYLDRIAESAVQYAERLLEGKKLPSPPDGIPVWKKLVYEYKDHGFVIDKNEATKLLGDMIKVDSKELILAEQIYKFLEEIHLLLRVLHGYKLTVIGSLYNGFDFFEIKN